MQNPITYNIVTHSIKRILGVLPPGYKKRSIKMMLLLLMNSILEMVGLAAFLPLFTVILKEGVTESHHLISKAYQFGGFTSENQFILVLAGLIVFVITFKNIMGLIIIRSQAKFSLSLYQYFAIRLHKLYYQKGFPFFKNTNSNVIMRDVNQVSQKFANQMVLPMFNFLTETFILVFILTSLFLYDWRAILLLSFTILPIFLLFYNWVKERSMRLEKETYKIAPKLERSIFQSIFGYIDVVITNSLQFFQDTISHYLNKQIKLSIKRVVYTQAPTRVIETGMVITIFVITAYGIFFLPDRAGLATLLGLFALAAYRILPSINRIMLALINIKGHQYTFDVVSQVKDLKTDADEDRAEALSIPFQRDVSLNNVSFRFPDGHNDVLKNINVKIKKGEAIGFMGPSGSGKTTLMNLMLGFWKPKEGTFKVDDTVLDESNLKAWHKLVGYVQQEVYLLDATLAENVAFGMPAEKIDHAHLEHVLKKTSLWDMVQELPDGVNTHIGERGTRLSGGQRQRIGIARAIYSGAEILFFDEATSALDTETEEDITESIRELTHSNLTIIVIAHRVTTLKYCDRIFQVSNGEITRETGYKEIAGEILGV